MKKDTLIEWNVLDCLFYKIDLLLSNIKNYKTIPDVEYMIAVETQHLKTENELLKALQYPKQVIKIDKIYVCPNKCCNIVIPSILVEKYRIKFCTECGQRIYYIATSCYGRGSQNE